jgi:hypothetical protein
MAALHVGTRDVAHARPMTSVPTAPPPGSMTVPPLFGWEHILTALALILLLGVAGLVLLAAGRAASGRSEWQAWLDGRSAERRDVRRAQPPE